MEYPVMTHEPECASQAIGAEQGDPAKLLQLAGLRLTQKRLALASLLFGKGDRHLTAEMVHVEATKNQIGVSLATVYNTINCLTYAGLLKRISVDGRKSYFDTNVSTHQHFYFESTQELVDICGSQITLSRMPELPEGYEFTRVELVVRLRKRP